MADMYQTIRNPCGPSQTVAYTGTAGTIGASLPPSTGAVQVICTTLAFVKISFGTSGTAATVTDWPIAPNVPMVLPINKPTGPGTAMASDGIWVSAIQSASGGNLHVLPLQA